jgi:redox-sensing transcriptional repressor
VRCRFCVKLGSKVSRSASHQIVIKQFSNDNHFRPISVMAKDEVPISPGGSSPADHSKIPQPTIERLSTYLQCVRGLQADGIAMASSSEIASRTGINAAQLRKDLSYFGEFGTPGLGYDVAALEEHLARIMGLDVTRDVLLVGAGNLGTALASYMGWVQRGFRIVAVFDADEKKIGGVLANCTIQHIDEISRVNARHKAEMGVVAVPRGVAQDVVDKLVASGVKSILNFAPTGILVRPGIAVRNVDLTSQLEVLSYYLHTK